MQLGAGWTYDPDDRIPGYEEFVTFRMGPRVRVYARLEPWQPATIAFVDESGTILTSMRLDCPPHGSVTAPSGVVPDSVYEVRITVLSEGRSAQPWERRIGVVEPELDTDRVRALNELHAGPADAAEASRSIRLTSSSGSLSGSFGHVKIVAARYVDPGSGLTMIGTNSMTSSADHEFAKEDPSDERWLTKTVTNFFDEVRAEAPRVIPVPAIP